jgi:CubicO group peptidase (beta-lactamase class C family)
MARTGRTTFDTSGLDALVDAGRLPGYAVADRRGGQVEVRHGGLRELEQGLPFEADTVHRVSSLSKPVAAILTSRLVDAGALDLDEPITTWLPELGGLGVLTMRDGPLGETEPMHRPVTVRDLLTMTSGFGIATEETPLGRAMDDAGVHPGPMPPMLDPDVVLERLAALPLGFQPGEGWAYHTSTDVLSLLLPRAAGGPLDALVAAEVREPLGLDVLHFHAPDPWRLAASYEWLEGGYRPGAPWGTTGPPPFLSLGAGLFTTAADYLRILDEIARPRILDPASAERIRTPQVTDAQVRAAGGFLPRGYSYGLQVAVAVADDPRGPRAGSFGWSGGSGCLAVVDPASDLIGVLLTNRQLDGPEGSPAFGPFLAALYR